MGETLRALRTSRYAALTALMLVVAALCVAAGTWQISRYDGKRSANDVLRRNDHVATRPVAAVLPLVGDPDRPTDDAVEFRPVTVSGTYDPAGQLLVRRRQVSDTNGYLVLTPLRTTAGPVVLVVRGFVAGAAADPGKVPAPPTGTVSLAARAYPPEPGPDKFATLHDGQVDQIVPSAAQDRLGAPVYDGYVQVGAGQPGVQGLIPIPPPDLSNPAGGAIEWQHLAYIVQWYLFAGLALAGPVVMVRTDARRAREDERERREAAARAAAAREREVDGPEPVTAAQRLADRYGRAR